MPKPSHYTTPRTLADCTFEVGFIQSISPFEQLAAYALAVAIGVCLALALVAWWAA